MAKLHKKADQEPTKVFVMRYFRTAGQACRDGKGRLALLTYHDIKDVKKLIMRGDDFMTDHSPNSFNANRTRQYFWVDMATVKNLHNLNITWTAKKNQESNCLILSKVYEKVSITSFKKLFYTLSYRLNTV